MGQQGKTHGGAHTVATLTRACAHSKADTPAGAMLQGGMRACAIGEGGHGGSPIEEAGGMYQQQCQVAVLTPELYSNAIGFGFDKRPWPHGRYKAVIRRGQCVVVPRTYTCMQGPLKRA